MGREIRKLENIPLLKLGRINTTMSRDSADIDEDHQYTSLKDIILNSPPKNSMINQEGNDFDSSNIAIKNQLVKHAASAYLQSAVVLASQNQNYFVRFWARLWDQSTLCSRWRVYVSNPIRACFRPIIRLISCMHSRG